MESKKQKYNSKNCVAHVAATAFECEVKEFEKFANKNEDGTFNVTEFLRFALSKGFYVGYIFNNPRFINNQLTTKLHINDLPALIVTNSKYNKNLTHAIYWDGKRVIDSDPAIDNPNLANYQLLAWYPIIKINSN